MSDLEQFDDELLSAYLDDELPPEERARVEERLAADPQARRLLDQLRVVSRSVQELPSATLDVDLREPILHRAERAMLVSGERTAAPTPSGVLHRLPFGRSKRAWFWAGAALAAGLLLMVIEREPQPKRGLPEQVALRGSAESDNEKAPTRPTSSLATEMGDKLKDELAAKRQVTPPAAVAAPAGGREGVAAGRATFGAAVVTDEPAAVETGDEELLVVHVVVAPTAFANRAFDGVLTQNRIQLETPPEDDMKTERRQDQEVDMVFVEAASAQIRACLIQMKADPSNFRGVEVDEQFTANQRGRAGAARVWDYQQYNYGSVPQQQQLQLAPNRGFSYQVNRGQIEIDRGLVDRREGDVQSLVKGLPSANNASRAVRFMQQRDTASAMDRSGLAAAASSEPMARADQPAEAASRRSYADAKPRAAAGVELKLGERADTMQVLFMLQPDTQPAAGLPAASPATAPVLEETGLQQDER